MALLLGIFFFVPLAGLLSLSLFDPGPTLAHFQEFLGDRTNWIILSHTFELAITVTLLCLLMGYPLAFWIVAARTWVARALLLAVVLPFFTSYLVRTYAWMVILGRFGVINQLLMDFGITERPIDLIYNKFSVLIAMVYILMPFTVLVLISVMRGIPSSLTRAAASLGASAPQNFWRVFFPLSLPGVIAAGLLVFVFALGFYITPALLGGPNTILLPMQIDIYANVTLNWPLAAAAATVLLSITLVVYTISNHFVGIDSLLGSQHGAAQSAGTPVRRSTTAYVQLVDLATALVRAVAHSLRVPAGFAIGCERAALGGKLLRGFSLLVAVFLVSPILIIVPISFSSSRFLDFPPPGLSLQWYEAYLQAARGSPPRCKFGHCNSYRICKPCHRVSGCDGARARQSADAPCRIPALACTDDRAGNRQCGCPLLPLCTVAARQHESRSGDRTYDRRRSLSRADCRRKPTGPERPPRARRREFGGLADRHDLENRTPAHASCVNRRRILCLPAFLR
ncbi:ABC transporter permease [Mesorhizobium sp. M1B.F.Ca.ET.045.04.1.1]|uniref:ABC transporter permease subunit n=1 Tax=Mesorhizobium sp. M1B.F.Ca.ET.045.04.1.1 TaxID=2493673 RepID=UPI001FDFC043|nr:ABC transporter permease [Mesorhizobium sp. M1B.F.Ca.ET.045.04.1.1]